MKIEIQEKKTLLFHEAEIKNILKKDLPLKKDRWNFNWRKLFKTEGAVIYKIVLTESPNLIQGVIMLTLLNEEMLIINNIELAPHNIGKNKIYENIAGSLIAFACKKSFENGIGHYKGFLSFESKTELINLYRDKYGAQHAMGHKMFFDPQAGKKLMHKYLQINK